ncbi:MAG: hypothetical protein M3Q65_24190 [Chloroflexota bacterium]|nr:hypothetical protein [Chloroflexota bacterium]
MHTGTLADVPLLHQCAICSYAAMTSPSSVSQRMPGHDFRYTCLVI